MGREFLTSAILTDASVLRETYIPEDAFYRNHQAGMLSLHLGPACQGERPMHVLLSGPSGAGKTLLAKKQLLSLKAKGVRGCYINAFEYSTYYTILDKLIKEERLLVSERRSSEHKLKALRDHLKDKPYVLILDEMDTLSKEERDKMLYNFSSIPKLGFVLISHDPCILFTSDTRVQSRIDPFVVECKPYEKSDMTQILKNYVELGLKEGSYDDALLEKIAEKANGDMRVAIKMLRNAAYFAQKERAQVIQERHLVEGTVTNRDLRHTHVLKSLKEDHRILYHIVKEKEPIVSGDLWKSYLQTCQDKKKRPLAMRSYQKYVHKLLILRLIIAEEAKMRGNVRVFCVAA